MLVITRRRDERVQIGDVIITILTTKANRVQIGIEAPIELKIDRLPAERIDVEIRRDGELRK